jgi:hypothetical protein
MRKVFLFAVAAAAVSAASISLASPPAHASGLPVTHKVVVRPVHANGTPAPGYRVVGESDGTFTCTDGPSPVAVDPNIRFCGPSATYTVACWKSANHTVLCLRDARARTLYRIHYSGSFRPVAKPTKPSPQDILLANGHKCLIRDGGAWSIVPSHPSWVGFYSCTGRVGDVYGPASGNGINRTTSHWTVETFATDHSITKRYITIAYYVGTA